MQFTIATVIAFAAAAQAGPLARRNQCDVAPSATANANITPFSQPTAATADACQQLCEADSSCQAFVFGLPESGNTPLCYLYNVPAAQIPTQSNTNLKVFDKACTDVPTTAPTQTSNSDSNTNNGNTNTNTGDDNTNNDNAQSQNQQPKKRNVCGAAPTGPSTSSPTPLLTRQDITTQDACLALCKQTSGCQAVEFGKPSDNEPVECLLFSVPASELPAPTTGQSLVAFDTAC